MLLVLLGVMLVVVILVVVAGECRWYGSGACLGSGIVPLRL